MDLTPANPQPTPHARFDLTVILPARNEEASLPACLASLLAQSEPGFALDDQWELLIVDDASTDRTPEIAAQAAATHPGVSVITPPALDPTPGSSFTGKTNACWAGAQAARGRWLLFTDADTLHQPGNLSRARHEAEKYHASLLSYSPRQIVTGLAQRTLMPLIFSELATIYPPAQVNDPNRHAAAANGQFLLIDAESYFAVGGHHAVGPNVLEDVALAQNIKRSKRTLRFRYAPDALSTRMYRSTPEMIEGWTKNLALLFPSPLALAAMRLLDILLLIGVPALALTLPFLTTLQRSLILLVYLRILWRFYARVARAHFPFLDTAISPLGLPLLLYLLIRSTIHVRLHKSVAWKGRTYRPSA